MSNPYGEYLEWEQFKETFGTKTDPGTLALIPSTSFETLVKAGKAIDDLPKWDLEPLVHLLYNKWPQMLDENILRIGIRRAVQARFYENLFGHPSSESMKKRDEDAIANMCLYHTPYQPPPKPEKKAKRIIQTKEGEFNEDVERQKNIKTSERLDSDKLTEIAKKNQKPKSEFAEKVSSMTLEQLITWALEAGVPQEKIDKHKDKPTGLAKMNISNMLRARVKC